MRVERVRTLAATELTSSDFSFEVNEEAVAPFEGPGLGAVAAVAPYAKHYPAAEDRMAAEGQSMIAVIRHETHRCIVAYLVMSRAWNHCTEVADVAVDRAHRRLGLARLLMDEAVRWSVEQDLPAIRLETQTNNVPACRFYERYGFKLGGFDRHLYDNIPDQTRPETALFWYLKLGADIKARVKP